MADQHLTFQDDYATLRYAWADYCLTWTDRFDHRRSLCLNLSTDCVQFVGVLLCSLHATPTPLPVVRMIMAALVLGSHQIFYITYWWGPPQYRLLVVFVAIWANLVLPPAWAIFELLQLLYSLL